MKRRNKKKNVVKSATTPSNVLKSLPEKLAEHSNSVDDVVKPDGQVLVKKQNLPPFRLQRSEYLSDLTEDNEKEILEDVWAWADGRGEIAVQPSFKGRRGLLVQQGGRGFLTFVDDPTMNHMNDYPEEKTAVLESDQPFTAEVVLVEDDEGNYRIYLIDLLFWGDSIVDEGYESRRKILVEFAQRNLIGSGQFAVLEIKWIQSITQLQEAVRWAVGDEMSNGALLKTFDGEYPTKLKTSDWFEIRKDRASLNTPISKQIDESSLIALAALGYKIEEITKETSNSLTKKKNKSNEKIKATILKSDEEKQFVLGVVLEPLEVDQQEDIMIPEDIEETAHDFLANHRVVGFRHKDKADAVVVESYIAPVDFQLDDELVKKGSWLLGVIVEDVGIWEKIKAGEINGFSVGGFGEREELE